jgi:hypothetical protein
VKSKYIFINNTNNSIHLRAYLTAQRPITKGAQVQKKKRTKYKHKAIIIIIIITTNNNSINTNTCEK